MDPLVSIIITCYNDVQYVDQAINSARSQVYSNKEIIVVDDGSNYETIKLLKSIEFKISKLIFQENLGQSTARNNGIKVSSGEYILILDSDDFFESTFCGKAIQYFKFDDNVKIVSCFANLLYSNGIVKQHCPKGGDISDFMFANEALGTSMFKKQDWLDCEGYDETMKKGFEDWEFFIRILKNGGVAKVLEEPLYNYRKRENTTTSKANQNKYEILAYIYTKHKDLYINNFDDFIKYITLKLKELEFQKSRQTEKIEYRLGYNILKPLRLFKNIFK
jgi:glycosyltransferase involved in cell wall biosynthesis